MSCPTVIRVTTASGPPGIGLPAGTADAGKIVQKDGATPYLYKLVTPGAASLPQPLAATDSPTFAGLTLSGLPASRLLFTGAGGVLTGLSLGSGLSIVGGALTATATGSGTVTSVGLSVPAGFSVTGSPVTTSGTLAIGFAAGYSLPSDATQAGWTAGAALAGTAIQPGNPALSDAREWSAATFTQAEAEDGASTVRRAPTGQRLRQAAAAWWQAASGAVGKALALAATQAEGRTALGLGSAATAATTDFATAAQGALASTAIQPGNPGLTTDLGYDPATRLLTSSTGADVTLTLADATNPGLMSEAGFSKLASITVDAARLVLVPVRNNSGASIAKGTPVYETSSSGTRITIAPADASVEATAKTTLGLVYETIGNNSDGLVLAAGQLEGLNTAGLVEGDTAWLSETTGQITTTRPVAPAHGVSLGFVIKSGAGTSGILYVKVDNGFELDELHNVLIVNPAQRQVLYRNAAGLWVNQALVAADISDSTTLGRQLFAIADQAAARTAIGAAASGAIGSSGLTMATLRLLGRTEAGVGAIELIEVVGATLAGGVLTITGGTASPGGSSGQVQFNAAGALGGAAGLTIDGNGNIDIGVVTGRLRLPLAVSASPQVGDVYLSNGSLRFRDANNAEQRPELTPDVYAVNNWITPQVGNPSAGGGMSANTIYLAPLRILRACTIGDLGVAVTTAVAGSSLQLALYARGPDGAPAGSPIASTASISAATATSVSGNISATLAPGVYWIGVNQTAAITIRTISGSSYSGSIIGANLLNDVLTPGIGRTLSSAFGTWPDLTVTPAGLNIALANRTPFVAMRITALP